MSKSKSKSQSFEDKLTRLEDIVRRMEDGSLPLEEAMTLFQEGAALAGECGKLLDNAEQEIVKLTKGPEGELEEVPYAYSELN